MERENLDWSSPQLSIPQNINERFVEFVCKVVLSTGEGKDVLQNRIIEKCPNVVNQMVNHVLESDKAIIVNDLLQEMQLTGKQWATVVMTLVCRGYYQDAEQLMQREEIDWSNPHIPLPNSITEQFSEFVCKVIKPPANKNVWANTRFSLFGKDHKYNFLKQVVRKLPHIVNQIVLYVCKEHPLESEDNYELMRIVHRTDLTDDTVMKGVNCAIEQKYKSTYSERWTCLHKPTAHTIFVVISDDLAFCARLICRQWGIDVRLDRSEVWTMLLDKFQHEITDDMKFKNFDAQLQTFLV